MSTERLVLLYHLLLYLYHVLTVRYVHLLLGRVEAGMITPQVKCGGCMNTHTGRLFQ